MDAPALHHAIAARLGGSLTASTELLGGSSTTVHRLDIDRGGTPFTVVARQHGDNSDGDPSGVARREFDVLTTLHDGFPVPEPYLLVDEDHVVVTEFVAGTPDVAQRDVASALDQMADTLVELHQVDPSNIASLQPLEDPVAELPTYLPGDSTGRRVLGMLGDVTLVEQRPVIVHGDYWPGNVLWRDGELSAVIDWEDVCVGDPIADLACARVELLCEYGEQAMLQFTDRYLRGWQQHDGAPLDTGSLPLWEIYVSVTALASMHEWNLSALDEATRRAATTTFFERAADDLIRD